MSHGERVPASKLGDSTGFVRLTAREIVIGKMERTVTRGIFAQHQRLAFAFLLAYRWWRRICIIKTHCANRSLSTMLVKILRGEWGIFYEVMYEFIDNKTTVKSVTATMMKREIIDNLNWWNFVKNDHVGESTLL